VIAVALRDPTSSLRQRNRLSGWLFGRRTELSLADPRLEILRRYVVLRRTQATALPQVHRQCLIEAGFAPQQIDEVNAILALRRRRRSITTNRATAARRPAMPRLGVAATLILLSLTFWGASISAQSHDHRIGERSLSASF
jgi:hypothetical protein